MNNFSDRLAEAIKKQGNPVLVGLDPRFDSLPESIKKNLSPVDWVGIAKAYATFCREVIDVVAPLVPAVKPQAAFFEQIGPPGMEALGCGHPICSPKRIARHLSTANATTSARRPPPTPKAYWVRVRRRAWNPIPPMQERVPGGPMP